MPFASLILGLLLWQAPADLSATKHADAVAAEIAPAVSAQLASGGIKASVRANTLTFWWVKQLAMKSTPAAWTDMGEGTLVGAVRIDKDFRDVRGRVVKAGVYTLRYGIQPANGDHLGVSPYRDFLLLSPASQDSDPARQKHDSLVDLSKQAIGGSHPAVWSIDPPVATDPVLTVLTTDLGHKAIVMEVAVAGGTFRFGLVLVGKIEA